jgi:hypothetical protein
MTANNNLMIQIIAAPLALSVNHSQPFGDKMFSNRRRVPDLRNIHVAKKQNALLD